MQLNHTLQTIPISEIKIDEDNPNVMTEKQMDALRKSMKRFGYLTPIIIDQDNLIADGEHRLTVYKEFGFTEIPCYKVQLKDDTERRMLRQTLNKLHGTHDKLKDADELLHIFENNRLEDLASLLAVERRDLEKILEKEKQIEFANTEQQEQEALKELQKPEPITQFHEIITLGKHRLMCGDSTNKDDIIKLLDNGKTIVKPSLSFDDPPYNIDFSYNQHDDKMTKQDYEDFCRKWYFNLISKDIECKRVIITPGPRNLSLWTGIAGEPVDIGIWHKPNSRSGASVFHFRTCEPILFYGNYKDNKKRVTDYFIHNRSIDSVKTESEEQSNITENAPAKPLKFIQDILDSFIGQDKTVLDLFGGAGTTLIAAELSGFTCYTMEKDQYYCDVIVKRWELITGKKASRYNQQQKQKPEPEVMTHQEQKKVIN